jgi:hypothetical protein
MYIYIKAGKDWFKKSQIGSRRRARETNSVGGGGGINFANEDSPFILVSM